jgi:hypothetical protein
VDEEAIAEVIVCGPDQEGFFSFAEGELLVAV